MLGRVSQTALSAGSQQSGEEARHFSDREESPFIAII